MRRFTQMGADRAVLITVSAPGLLSFPKTVDLRSGEELSLPVKLNFDLMGDIVMIEPGSMPSRDSLPSGIARSPAIQALDRDRCNAETFVPRSSAVYPQKESTQPLKPKTITNDNGTGLPEAPDLAGVAGVN